MKVVYRLGRRFDSIFNFNRDHAWIWAIYSLIGIFLLYFLLSLISVSVLPLPKDLQDFSNTLWQVECSLLAFTAIVVTVIITVMADREDKSDIWSDYKDDSYVFPILFFHLTAIVGDLAVSLFILPAASCSNVYLNIRSLVLGEIISFIATVGFAIFLYHKTFCFLSTDYIIHRSKLKIKRLIRIETQSENYLREKNLLKLIHKGNSDASK